MSGAPAGRPYADNFAHLDAELRRLDLLIRLRVATIALHDQSFPEAQAARTVYITRQEVDWLLARDHAPAAGDAAAERLRAELIGLSGEIAEWVRDSAAAGVVLTLPRLAGLFGLSAFETQTVVICLAPELRRKYDRLYAYLQDDITRKRPSVDLVLELLCDSERERWHAQSHFADTAPLLRCGLLQKVDDPQSPSGSSGLSQFLRLDPRILQLLLGSHRMDVRLVEQVTLYRPTAEPELAIEQASSRSLLTLIDRWLAQEEPDRQTLVLSLHGPDDVGRRELALHACRHLDISLLCIDAASLFAQPSGAEDLVRLACREGLMQQAALYVERADTLLQESARPLLKSLTTAAADYCRLVFLSGRAPWTAADPFAGAHVQPLAVPFPDVPLRVAVWRRSLAGHTSDPQAWAVRLACQFRLTSGQVRTAVETAVARCSMEPEARALTLSDVAAACRQQSSRRLDDLALKIEPRYSWDDFVLPPDELTQLREICDQVRHHHQVIERWGFGSKLSRGKGVSVLFSGPPGTGKTMAAEVVAYDLELDLYKVDLSGVVSKYIGETEKNVARIFEEAEASNAILFFDEADALFGKRTEVSDAHDRYANIETSYLLQRMEEYAGIVVLATNLRQNMDEAFTRRIRFIVNFPFPDETSRLRIWQTHFPVEAPVSPEVDYEYLARAFPIAGGSIKNTVLNAAFLAAANGGTIDTRHVLHGMRREFEKIGKLWTDPLLPGGSNQ
jgi:hypothetical protein